MRVSDARTNLDTFENVEQLVEDLIDSDSADVGALSISASR